jgi:beta-lactamase regulating signal transducer with metallopeptidase domain
MSLPTGELAGLAWSQLGQVTVLALVVGALVRVGCRRRPHLAYLLWMLVVVKCLTPPVWSSPTGLFSWAQLERVPAASDGRPGLGASPSATPSPSPARLTAASRATGSSDEAIAAPPPSPAVPRPASTPETSHARSLLSAGAALAKIWLAGAVGLGGVILLKWLSFRRRLCRSAFPAGADIEQQTSELAKRLGVGRKLQVLVASEPVGPAVFGLVRPTIALPQAVVEGKTREQLEPVLAHELLHVRRGDVFWGAFQVLVEVIWWFHPLVWWANREACREREMCCDEAVVSRLNCRPAAYARCLLDVLASERRGRPALAVLGVQPIHVTSKRLEHIMRSTGKLHPRTPSWCWAVLIAAAAVVLPGRELVLGGRSIEAPNETSAAEDEPQGAGTSQMSIRGQVLDASGHPVAGADVVAIARSRRPTRGGDLADDEPKPLDETTTDAQGGFRLRVPPLSSTAFFSADVVAAKPGHAVGWEPLALDADTHQLVIRLSEEQTLRGRVVDDRDRPAAGARVYVRWIGRLRLEMGTDEGVGPGQPREQFPAWPEPVTTDDEGRFAIRGVSRQHTVSLRVADDRFATWHFYIEPLGEKPPVRDAEYEERTRYLAKASEHVYADDASEPVTLRPPPAQIIEGQVVYEDTGEPAAHARLTAYARQWEFGSSVGIAGQADASGRFRLNPFPGKLFHVTAYPPKGQPYLILKKTVTWPEGAAGQEVALALPRGVLARGQITEQPSGKPVQGAAVQYYAASGNPHLSEDVVTRWQAMVVSDAEGRFEIAVPAGKGALLVHGPTPDYVQQVIGAKEIYYDRPGGMRLYVHASVPLDLDPGAEAQAVAAPLQRGVTVNGRLVGPSGEALDEALLVTHLYVSSLNPRYTARPVDVREGRFELPGCHPEKTTPVYFLDPKNELGAVVEISGQTAGDEPMEVRLAPCGTATVRFVDPDGKPVADYRPGLKLVMTPGGRPFPSPPEPESEALWAAEDFVANFDRLHYWDGPRTDEEGRCTLPDLIPGATYQLDEFDKASSKWTGKQFRVDPGEILELPAVVIKRPSKAS